MSAAALGLGSGGLFRHEEINHRGCASSIKSPNANALFREPFRTRAVLPVRHTTNTRSVTSKDNEDDGFSVEFHIRTNRQG